MKWHAVGKLNTQYFQCKAASRKKKKNVVMHHENHDRRWHNKDMFEVVAEYFKKFFQPDGLIGVDLDRVLEIIQTRVIDQARLA